MATHAARTHHDGESAVLLTMLSDGTPVRYVPTWGKAHPYRYAEYVRVTPELALEMLSRNTRNRPLNVRASQRLARDIVHGHWQVTHQGIAFDRDGVLSDGQHRLQAICTAQTAADLLVFYNQPQVGGPIDCGQKRTNIQQGMIDEPHVPAEQMRARHELCSVLVQLENGGACPVAKAASDDKYASMKHELDWMVKQGRVKHLSAAVRAAFVYAYPIDPEKVTWAWERFLDGDGLHKKTALHTLREHLGPSSLNKHGAATHFSARLGVFRRVLRALLSHLQGKSISTLRDGSDGLDWFTHQRKLRDLAT